MSVIAKLLKLLKLSVTRPRRVVLLARCFAVVLATRLLLTLLSYRRMQAWRSVVGERPPAPREERETVAWGVERAARLVPGATCLTQALAAQYLLARRGFSSRVRIGVALKAGTTVTAHAWLTSGDSVVIGGGPALARYAWLTDLGAGAS